MCRTSQDTLKMPQSLFNRERYVRGGRGREFVRDRWREGRRELEDIEILIY